MRALVWQGAQDFRIENVPGPVVERGRLIVKVAAAAVCGSDFHMDDFGTLPPLVLGHEVAGTVHEIGDGVEQFHIGDRVVLNPVQTCGTCWCCQNGVGHLCENYRHLGIAAIQGGWAEYVAIDAANTHHIPHDIDFASASLIEPLAVCYESFQRASLQEGQTVLIIGDGPFGFLHAQVARSLGAGKIVVAGHYDRRLARIAKAAKITTCNSHNEDISGVVEREIGSPGVDVVIEATGAGPSPNIGLKVLRPRGTIVIFSYVWKPDLLEMGLIHMRELNMLGACRSLNAYEKCIGLMQSKTVDTGLLIDRRLALVDYSEAIDAVQNHKAEVFKVVFEP